ncbi:MAG: tetratricopeptide repeat protein [Sandaracinaceae bacterium]|nr:tetratricopeptide repeat protein [Sandaracinaceae bacterium]
MNRLIAWVGALAIVLATAGGHAQDGSQDAQARALFDAGRTAYDAGRFEQALRYFQEAYDLSRRPALLFNIASAADRLLMVDRALEAYRAYLQAVPNAPNRELAQSRITFLESHRGTALPTPQQAAQQAQPPPTEPPATSQQQAPLTPAPAGGGDVTGEWWFWTLIGVLVVGAAVGVTVGVAVGTSGVQEPLQGSVPVTFALEGL